WAQRQGDDHPHGQSTTTSLTKGAEKSAQNDVADGDDVNRDHDSEPGGLSERHANARRVLQWIRKNNKAEVSRADIRRDALGQGLDADQTQNLIDGVVRAGWFRQVTTMTPGRARHRWTVNPKLFLYGTAGSAESAERL